MKQSDLKKLSLEQLIQASLIESRQDAQDEEGYCFELFRRALDGQEERAWTAVERQYRKLVWDWLTTFSQHTLSLAEMENLLQETYIRFWQALRKQPDVLSHRFTHVGELLCYLKGCVFAAYKDYTRYQRRQAEAVQQLKEELKTTKPELLADTVFNQLDQEEQWQRVQRWAEKWVEDEKEKIVLACLYRDGLKPRDVFARYPDQFESGRAVLRVRERLLRRARRALVED